MLKKAAILALVLWGGPGFAWTESPQTRDALGPTSLHTQENHCPAGLHLVVFGGLVSCGAPVHHQTPATHFGQGSDAPARVILPAHAPVD
jgi:hypothetical protein